ncbi:hypothetical protein CPB83DRAFT_148531 [Crepidotus variabilis]|uniref:Uncharacterized protein n=1 Tax=Crepidotus variabilis TaxID=179855 RepID=A0A9P6EKZ9_9AGAR|nr:hypothetical protein CPB83DRAFT_148531 [Crepidotus variabilis]
MAPQSDTTALRSYDSPDKFRSLRFFFSYRRKRDGMFTTTEMTPLPARSINHLSIWAYLAIGGVIFCASVITGYLVYSCYYSAKKRQPSTEEAVDDMRLRDVLKSSTAKSRLGDLEKSRTEKVSRSTDTETGELQLVKPGVRSGGTQSESKRKTMGTSRISVTNATSARESDIAFESHHHPPTPRTTHSSAHPQSYPEMVPSDEPTTPLNLSFPDKPFPISGTYTDATSSSRNSRRTGEKYDDLSDGPSSWRTGAAASPHKRSLCSTASTRFDSNNIRFIPPLNPHESDPLTAKLYNEPKLSPIHGSLIGPQSPSTPSTPGSATTLVFPHTPSSPKSFKWPTKRSRSRSASEVQPRELKPSPISPTEPSISRGIVGRPRVETQTQDNRPPSKETTGRDSRRDLFTNPNLKDLKHTPGYF